MTSITGTSLISFWQLANAVNDISGLDSGDHLYAFYWDTGPTIYLRERDASTNYSDTYAGATATQYWYELERDEAVGTYGTIYLRIYSNSSRTTLLDTLSIALHTSLKDYRYLYVTNTLDDAGGSSATGYSQNYDLMEAVGGATGKSNPLYGPLGGPLYGPIG